MTLVDTNILLDLATRDAAWWEWSLDAVKGAAIQGPLYINGIIYAELSARYSTAAEVDEFIDIAGVQFLDIPRKAAFLAAKAFGRYRAAGGSRTGVLSDFFIGGHAVVLDIPILTRDVRRYRTYFPDLRLIAPQLN
ncbi:type II toxin-antitoxin system VapC family toxin [Arvimicrobium flavum]|uniref:type II toxin-antitoxin system VapC family toxin n=1 Tax=Arvimicrobium flavum TaxID=3393320 RepID=UPI00237A7D49|nr:type II toxin-antitoxin system VapC family toxin [Mesorhizobium shangrilense]